MLVYEARMDDKKVRRVTAWQGTCCRIMRIALEAEMISGML